MATRKNKKKSSTSAKPRLAPDGILQLGLAFWGSKTLLSAIELGVFTELARGPVEAKTLRQRLKLHERSARDFLNGGREELVESWFYRWRRSSTCCWRACNCCS